MADEEESPTLAQHYHAALVLYSLKHVEKATTDLQQLKAKILANIESQNENRGPETEISNKKPTTPQDSSQPATAAESELPRIRIPVKISSQRGSPTRGIRIKSTATPKTESSDVEEEESDVPSSLKEEEINRMIQSYQPPATPPFQSLQGLVGACSQPFEKQLTDSDVKDGQSRLTINKSHAQRLRALLRAGEVLTAGIQVTVYDEEGKEYPMTFKVWEKVHVLTAGWKQFYKDHKLLKHQDFVTLWMFRNVQNEGLCFAISWRRLPVFAPLKRRRIGGAN